MTSSGPPARHVFITFLGTSPYKETSYTHDGRALPATPYAAIAELEGPLAADPPTHILVVVTSTAKKRHGERRVEGDRTTGTRTDLGPGLLAQLRTRPTALTEVLIPEDLSTAAQWSFFEQLVGHIHPGDAVSIDMTHGFRAVPIVISSALHFLRIVRGIQLRHVFYANYDATPQVIVDYRDFYAITEWTEAVGRLVDNADASGLAELSRTPGGMVVTGLGDDRLQRALTSLTASVRDVDIQHAAGVAADTLNEVEAARRQASGVSALLLDMVKEKFHALVGQPPASGRYDDAYFSVQFALIELLLDHGLNMQAFTTLRECVHSFGVYDASGLRRKDLRKVKDARGTRMRADIFGAMVRFNEAEWSFPKQEKLFAEVEPWYRRIQQAGLVDGLRITLKAIQDIRNGFDHAWTIRPYPGDTALTEEGRRLLGSARKFHAELSARFSAPATSAPG